MNTALCPRCHHSIDSQAVVCPNCHTTIKAFGHRGIPLYRTDGTSFLCARCSYDADNTCNFPQRPYAQECILYQDINKSRQPQKSQLNNFSWNLKSWLRRHQGLLMLVALLLISLLIAL